MRKFLLDTNIWIDFLNKQDYAINLINKLTNRDKIFSSVLTVTELRAGWTDEKAKHFLSIFNAYTKIVTISTEIAEMAGKFLYNYKRKGISLSTVDALIAATAILEKCQLVTRNKKDFPMPEIKFYPIEE